MLKEILKNNGATINARGECVTLKSGYQVSIHDLGRISKQDLTEQMIRDVISYGLKRGEYCGIWIDNGYAYVDISRRVKTKKDAIKLGKEKNQLSIFNWYKNNCIALS